MTAPVRLHAAKTKPYLYLMDLTMKGVKNARRKFQSQLDAVASAAWRARVRVGKVSPMRIQIPLQRVVSILRMRVRVPWTYGAQVIA